MARRDGFLSRITQGIGRFGRFLGGLFGEGAEPPAPPREPPGPPAPPPPRREGPGPSLLTPENQIWQRITVGNDRYDADLMGRWYDLYQNSVVPLDLSETEFYHFWQQFLQAFYLTTGERQHQPRETFYRELGVRKRDFGMDWQEWRELKRGTP